jgi:methylthioribose-1-phosphate isomerase
MATGTAPEALISIKTSDDKIQIVNQLLLPHKTEWLSIDTIEQAHDAIKTMKVSRHIPVSLASSVSS